MMGLWAYLAPWFMFFCQYVCGRRLPAATTSISADSISLYAPLLRACARHRTPYALLPAFVVELTNCGWCGGQNPSIACAL